MMARAAAFLLAVFLVSPATGAEPGHITLASTTSTEQSGLFDHLLPRFHQATGIEVHVLGVGTGQAFEIARRGDADAVLVHDPAGEQAFVDRGYGIDRRQVMYNDLVLVGPAEDPAGIASAGDVGEALAAIAETAAPFASRGDDSGTHRMELRLWRDAGIDLEGARGAWYRELGSGMGPTLNTAAGMDAYTLSDRATWASFRNRQNLALLLTGDPALHNPYGSILVNPDRHPHVKIDAARAWHQWLSSGPGRQAIRSFRIDGRAVFFVD